MVKPEYRDMSEKAKIIFNDEVIGDVHDYSVTISKHREFNLNGQNCSKGELQIEGKTYTVYMTDDELNRLFSDLTVWN